MSITKRIRLQTEDSTKNLASGEFIYDGSENQLDVGEGRGGIKPPEGTIEITMNGVKDVTQYATAIIDVPVGVTPEGTKEIIVNGEYDVSTFEKVNVDVDQGVIPVGTKYIDENGTYDVEEWKDVEVSVPQGVFPSGTLNITDNGNYNVREFANAVVNVDKGITPIGTKNITANGDYDVKNFANAKVNVPQGVFPSGTKEITENGVSNVRTFENVNVNVPQGVFPSGTKEITENGVSNVREFENVNVNVPQGVFPSGTKVITENGVTDVTNYAEVDVNVEGVVPTGTKEISENGLVDVTDYANANVNVPQGYLCKISRYFEENTACTLVTITHNIGNTNYYADVYIDSLPETSGTATILSCSSSFDDTKMVARVLNISGTVSSAQFDFEGTTTTLRLTQGGYMYRGGHTYTFYFYAKNDVSGLPTVRLQNKSVTENGYFTPDSGYSGFSSVNVEVEQGEALPEIAHTGTVEVLTDSKVFEFEHGFDVAPRLAYVVSDSFGDFTDLSRSVNAVHAAFPMSYSPSTGKINQITNLYCNSRTDPKIVTSGTNIPIDLFSIDDESVHFELNPSSSVNFKRGTTYRWYAYL